jgi:PBSX family phage terminase large subunit
MLLQSLAKKRRATLTESKAVEPEFRGSANVLQTTQDFEVIIQGPAETGKTFAALWRVDRFLRTYPNSVGIVVRKTRSSLFSTVLRTYSKIIHLRGNDVLPYGGQKPEWYDYPNGSRLYVDGLDKAEKLLSGEFDIIYFPQCEEGTLADWETLTTRATGRAGNAPYTMIIGDCNPATQHHWILQRKSIELLQSFHTDNPRLYDALGQLTAAGKRTMAILGKLTGVRFFRLFKGLWTSSEGAIYADYDPQVHLCNWFEPPRDWLRIVGIDFGYRNPFVCQWWCLTPDDILIMYREIYMTGVLVDDHAKHIQQLEKWYYFDENSSPLRDALGRLQHNPDREHIHAYIADHDAEDRATLAKNGIDTIPAFKGVKLGIEAVQLRMRKRGDGKARIVYMRDALVEIDQTLVDDHKPTCTIEEIESYVWAKSTDGKPSKEEPVKKDDHGMDDTRYVVAFVDQIGQELEETTEYVVYTDVEMVAPL